MLSILLAVALEAESVRAAVYGPAVSSSDRHCHIRRFRFPSILAPPRNGRHRPKPSPGLCDRRSGVAPADPSPGRTAVHGA